MEEVIVLLCVSAHRILFLLSVCAEKGRTCDSLEECLLAEFGLFFHSWNDDN